jgi:transcriptional regulator with XRE-family HTH domain
MIIGKRLRQIREQKNLSQGDIERKTGLLRSYISRIENGHAVPAIETLKKLAKGLEVPLYQLFYDAEEMPELPALSRRKESGLDERGAYGKQERVWHRLHALLSRMDQGDANLLLHLAQKMVYKSKS